jgi:hypothetical protein
LASGAREGHGVTSPPPTGPTALERSSERQAAITAAITMIQNTPHRCAITSSFLAEKILAENREENIPGRFLSARGLLSLLVVRGPRARRAHLPPLDRADHAVRIGPHLSMRVGTFRVQFSIVTETGTMNVLYLHRVR